MAVLTTLERLENVQTAIQAIESGAQSYAIGNRRLTRADLGILYKREKELIAQYKRETHGRLRTLGRFEEPI